MFCSLGSTSINCFRFFLLLSFLIPSLELSFPAFFAAYPAKLRHLFGEPSRLLVQGGGRERTYYISPNGSDTNSGVSTSSPWKTFTYAIPHLNAGDTLVLMDGTYTTAGSGNLTINCTASKN